MLPSPRDELRNYLIAHQAHRRPRLTLLIPTETDPASPPCAPLRSDALCLPQKVDDYQAALGEQAGRLEMQGTATAELKAAERDRKRPSTGDGARKHLLVLCNVLSLVPVLRSARFQPLCHFLSQIPAGHEAPSHGCRGKKVRPRESTAQQP